MSDDKMRAGFEEWFDKECGDYANFSGRKEIFKQAFWQVWKASRSALLVELPDWEDYDISWRCADAVESALDAAGVAYK